MKDEILQALRDQVGDIGDFVWSRIDGTIKEMVDHEIDRRAPRRGPGRPRGRRNFGATDYWKAVEEAAKTAPVSLSCWPNTAHWREAFYRCGTNRLLVPTLAPAHSPWAGEYFAHVNAPWRHDRQPFDALDLRIARELVDYGSVAATNFSVEACKHDIRRPFNKLPIIVARLKNLAAQGLAVFDPAITTRHAGDYRPRWYRPTEKLSDILLMM